LIAAAVVDLPEPDSPTTATVSPAATSIETLLTAVTRSLPDAKATERPLMRRTGSFEVMSFTPVR
jgi:hypothetical protein